MENLNEDAIQETRFRNSGRNKPRPSTSSTAELILADDTEGKSFVAPDGGYGYVIVFAAFISNMIVDGVALSFGVLKDSILASSVETLPDLDHVAVAWIGSLMTGFYLFAGPFVSAMANKFGFRIVAVSGSITTSAAFILSWYLNQGGPNIGELLVIYGIVGGIGFSCIYMSSVVMVGFYFEKRRALATGIAVCGSGIGNFIFPPLIEFIASRFQWQGVLFILGIVVLVCGMLGLLYKPLAPNFKNVQIVNLSQEGETEGDMENTETGNTPRYYIDSLSEQRQTEFIESPKNVTGTFPSMSFPPDDINVQVATHEETGVVKDPASIISHITITVNAAALAVPTAGAGFGKHVTDNLEDTEAPKQQKVTGGCLGKGIEMRNMLDFSLLKSPTFLVFCLASMFTLLGMLVPFVYLMDQARFVLTATTTSPAEQALPWLISIIGAANTFGRIISGWIADRPNITALLLNNVAVTLMGLSTMLVPFLRQYYQFAVYSGVFGLSMACFASLRSILVVELFGLSKLTDAYGFVLLFEGIASTVSTPLAGIIMQVAGETVDFSISFYFAGGSLLVSAFLFSLLNSIQNWEQSKEFKGSSS